MCGIVGILGNIEPRHGNLFRDMWVVDALRGEDSSGLAFINANNHVRVIKDVGVPYDLFYTKSFIKACKKKSICVIGHNRSATMGKVSQEMAHPFECGHIIGVHNGTLRAKWRLLDHTKFASDSENIFHSIKEIGVADTWTTVDGAACLIWWDRERRTLNMLRNDERPMFFTFVGKEDTKGSVMVWASEYWMLNSLMERRKIEHGQIWKPKPHTHFEFSYDTKKKEVTYIGKKLKRFTLAAAPEYKAPAVPHGNVLPFTPNLPDPKGYYVNIDLHANKMTPLKFYADYQECAFCGSSLIGEFKTSIVLDAQTALCGLCKDETDERGIPLKLLN